LFRDEDTDDEILIAGSTTCHHDVALSAIMKEWTAAGNNRARKRKITNGKGLTSDYRIDGQAPGKLTECQIVDGFFGGKGDATHTL
jgi:hypothetical protein